MLADTADCRAPVDCMRRGVPPQAQRAVLSQAAADTSESATKALQLERVAQELAARAQTLADRETALYIREVGSQRGGGGGRVPHGGIA